MGQLVPRYHFPAPTPEQELELNEIGITIRRRGSRADFLTPDGWTFAMCSEDGYCFIKDELGEKRVSFHEDYRFYQRNKRLYDNIHLVKNKDEKKILLLAINQT